MSGTKKLSAHASDRNSPITSSNGKGDSLGWPQDTRERADFYHPPRTFPPATATWRKGLLLRVLENRRLYAVIPPDATEEEIRQRIDYGIAALREIARILSICHGALQSGSTADPTAALANVRRLIARIEPYPELGLSFARLGRKRLDATIGDLIPPSLSDSLRANLDVHAQKVCLSRRPLCEKCQIRKFCATFRRAETARAEATDAPSVVDLFAGAGGLSEGFRRARFRTILALDNDPVSLRTYWLNHPEIPHNRIVLRDIREVGRGELRRLVGRRTVDVLIGAPPCQGFSHAGFRSKRARTGYSVTSDARNYLFQHMVAAALELKPRLVLMENVPGMQSARRADVSFLETAASMLQRRGGYHTAIWRLNAAAFGVPQDRIRYFLVASRTGLPPVPPGEEYQDIRRPGFDTDALPPVTLDEAIFDLPAREAGTGTAVDRFDQAAGGDASRFRRFLTKHAMLCDSSVIYNHHVRYNNERDLELYALLRPGEDSVHAVERHGRRDLMRYRNDVFDDKYYRLRPDRPCKTIVAHLAKDGNGYIHPYQTRSISVREAARVQSFPDDYVFCGSPSDQWVQVGNAVPPAIAEAIAMRFNEVLQGETDRRVNRKGRR